MSPAVTPDSTVAELLAQRPGAARVLISHGMHCVGCAIAPFEAIAEACAIYGVAVEAVLQATSGPAPEHRDRGHDQKNDDEHRDGQNLNTAAPATRP
jgi:hybrid cluster-associated redox disulfide protein